MPHLFLKLSSFNLSKFLQETDIRIKGKRIKKIMKIIVRMFEYLTDLNGESQSKFDEKCMTTLIRISKNVSMNNRIRLVQMKKYENYSLTDFSLPVPLLIAYRTPKTKMRPNR